MKTKISLIAVLMAVFTGLDANALVWTGTEDLSSINAQIVCTGTDCVLSNIAAGDITGQVSINGVTGLNSFVLAAANDDEDPTNLVASVDNNGLLEFNGFQANNVELNGNIENAGTGYGVYFLNSYLTGNLNVNGNVSRGNALLYIDYSIFDKTVEINGDILNAGDFGINIVNSKLNEDLIINGDISATGNYGILLGDTVIKGDVIANGDISVNALAINIDNSAINGDFITNGIITASDAGFSANHLNINGDIITYGNILVFNNIGFSLGLSYVNGDVITNGDISAGGNGFDMVMSTINGSLITNGNISVTNDIGLSINASSINGNVITNGDISANTRGITMNSLTKINGDVITNGDISAASEFGLLIENLDLVGNMITNGNVSATNNAIFAERLNISGNMITNGDISAAGDIGIYLSNSVISGNVINDGDVSANNFALFLLDSSVDSNIINNGKIVAGTIDPDGTINATGDLALLIVEGNMLNKNFINTGTIASASEGIKMSRTRIFGDFINSGQILGGDTDFYGKITKGLYIVDSSLMGQIKNTETGLISGQYGITLSQDYDDFNLGTYASKNLDIVNNGNIVGVTHDAIAFDVIGASYDNILSYSGAGTLNGAIYDIDMGGGEDVLNLNNVRAEWFKTNGAETINISNYIVQSTYVDGLTAMNENIDTDTTDFNISRLGFLVDTAGTYTSGSDLYVMSGVDAMTDADLVNMDIQLEGFAGTDGYFFLDGTDLMYHLSSVGSVGANSDQAVSGSVIPVVTALNSSVSSAQSINRSAMNMVSGRMMKLDKEQDFNPSGLWTQGFGEKSTYDGKIENGVARSVGYDSTNYGLMIGYDKYLGKGLLLGAALSYGMGKVKGEIDQFKADIKQYQLNLYGSYNLKNYFVDAQVGIGVTKYDQKRSYVGTDATAKYDGKSVSAGLGAGYVWNATDRLSVTPYTRFNYIQSNQDGYLESSNLRVDAVELKSSQASFGTDIGYNLFSGNGMKWQPKLFVEYAREMGDDEIAINSQYMDNLAIGTTGYSPDLGSNIFRTGAGITMMGAENDYNVSVDYKYETRESYESHGVMLNGKMFF